MTAIYEYVPHVRTQEKLAQEPRASDDGARCQPDRARGASRVTEFNRWLAVKVTSGVGTMWCAYAFAALALVSLPSAVRSGSAVVLVSWISQTFLQLVLLSVIIVGQKELASAADQRAESTHDDADAVLHETVKLQEHLQAQDAVIVELLERLERLEPAR